MERTASAPPWAKLFTAAERPDLWLAVRSEDRFAQVWPEYNNHGNHTGSYFGALFPQHADLQVLVVDDRSGQAVARGRTIPFRWDGSLQDLPPGIDAAGRRAVEEPAAPTALSALAAEVLPDYQGSGLSRVVIEAMAAVARSRHLDALVAPVRPNWKDRYPITPIERYVEWRRPDGRPFDPWMRVHARLGASILRPEPRSLWISAPVSDWEGWVGMAFLDEGEFVFPGGLAPLTVRAGTGEYWEPNVWMRHPI